MSTLLLPKREAERLTRLQTSSTERHPEGYPVYEEADDKMVRIARYADPNWSFTAPRLRPLKTRITLYEQQKASAVALTAELRRNGGAYFHEETGGGKTILALHVRATLGCRKTLVLVDQINLLQQWTERIHEHIGPKVNVGIFGNRPNFVAIRDNPRTKGTVTHLKTMEDLQDHPGIAVATLQGLTRRTETVDVDMLIGDEAHVMAAPKFLRSIFRVNFTYSLALSATDTRKDGNEWVFKIFLGPKTVKGSGGIRTKAEIVLVKVRVKVRKPKDYQPFFCKKYFRQTCAATCMEGYLDTRQGEPIFENGCAYKDQLPHCPGVEWVTLASGREVRDQPPAKSTLRNVLLRDVYTNTAYFEEVSYWCARGLVANRKAYCFVQYKWMAQMLFEDLSAGYPGRVGLYIGSARGKKATEALEKDLTITTEAKSQKGLDEKSKDYLVFALPSGNTQQIRGRIERQKSRTPVFIDIRARNVWNWQRHYEERDADYRKNKYRVRTVAASSHVQKLRGRKQDLAS